MKVLIVEDNKDSRNLLAKQLRAYGNEVMEAADGVEALERALKELPDILVSDILMPRMDGYQLCYDWKRNARLKDIPFVFYTAIYTSPQDERFALSLGASHFIRKPTEPEALAKILAQVLEQARQGRLPVVEAVPLKPSLYLSQYNKRLVAKLNEKVAELERSEQELRYLSSVLGAIRNVNQLIVREGDKTKLLQGACKILLKVREYRFVWIGLIKAGTKKVIAAAKAGVEDGYLDAVKVSRDEGPSGRGPLATAIRTGKPDLIKNIQTDPRAAPWREEAFKRGYHSSAVIPLVHGDQVYGALNVYSTKSDGFKDAEVALLVEVSRDLGFALKAMEEEEGRKQAEEALRENEAFQAGLLANSPIPINVINPDSSIRYVNPALEKLTGFSTKELIGRKAPYPYWPKEGVNKIMKGFRSAMRRSSHRVPELYQKKSGEEFWIEITSTPVREDGKLRYLLASWVDVTERRRAGEALRESEARYRAVIEDAHDMIQSISLDGSIIFVNKAWLNTLGYTKAELSGLNLFDIIHPDSMAHCQRLFKQVISGHPVHDIEAAFLTKDGRKVLVEGNAAPRYIEDRVVASQGIFRDVTDRKRAAVALAKAEQEKAVILDSLSELVVFQDPEHRIILANRAAAESLGLSPEQLIGRHCHELWGRSTEPCAGCPLEKVLETGQPQAGEMTTPDGRVWSVRGYPVWDEKGDITSLVEMALDITERKQAEEQLQAEQNKLQSLVSAMEYTLTIQDKDFNIIYQNESSKQASGGDHVGEKCYRVYEGRDTVCPGCPVALAFKDGQSHVSERRRLEPTGAITYWENTANPIRDAKGELTSCLELARDISERKRAEQRLQESEEKFSKAFRASADAICITSLKDNRFIEINEAFTRFTGYSREETIGHSSVALGLWVDEEELKRWQTTLQEKGKVYNAEFHSRMKSGEIRIGLASAETINIGGEPCRITVIADVTESKQAEEALRESEEKFRELAESITDVFFAFDKNLRYTYWNKASEQLTGVSAKDALGKHLYDIFPESGGAKNAEKMYLKALKTQKVQNFVNNFQLGGKDYIFEINAYPSEDGLSVFVKDVTESKQAEEALRESDAFQSSLLANSPIPINVIDPDSSLRYVNPALERLTGFLAEELIGQKAPYPYWPKERHQEITEDLKKSMRQGAKGLVELYQKKNGESFWVEITSTPVKKDGKFQYLLGSWVDITERRKAEEEVARLARFPAENPAPVVRVAQDGTVLYANQAAVPLLGDWQCQIGQQLPKYWREFTSKVLRSGKRKGVEVNVGKQVFSLTFSPVVEEGYVNLYGLDITERKLAEAALADEATRHRILIDESSDGIAILDEKGGIYEANLKFAEMLGYTPEEVLKLHVWDFETLLSPEQVLEMIKNIGPKGDHFETKHRRKDGTVFDVEISSNGAVYAGQKLIFSVCHDITERKKAEAALRDEATRHRILIDESRDGIVVLDENGKVYEANKRFAEMLGYTPEEAQELYVWDWEFQFPREQVAEMIRTVDETGDHFETKHRRKDGSIYDVEISTNGTVYAGQKLIFCVCRDITERKLAAAALKESEEKYKTLVEATSDIIWEVDDRGLFTFVSPRIKDMLGYEVDEVVGKKRTLDLIPKGEVKKWLKRFKEVNAKMVPFFGFEMTHLHKSGRTVICEVSGIPLFDSGGNFKGFIGINKDITSRKQMQEQLVITDRLASVGELAAGIAHELNNPLTGVIGFSQLLMDKEMPEGIREDVKVIYGEAQRAAQVVKNLLTFARRHTAAKQMVDINGVIEKVQELRAYEQRVENIKVKSNLAADLPEVMADYFQLQQVFLNIIINAEYFMKEAHNGGTLTITTERVDNKVRASFADDGPGIAQDDLGHLFDPFFTTKEVGKGTGLGLSICHGIIAEHGGRIYVESELGKGANFIVELPVSAADKKGGQHGNQS